jgi:hypothetical protein
VIDVQICVAFQMDAYWREEDVMDVEGVGLFVVKQVQRLCDVFQYATGWIQMGSQFLQKQPKRIWEGSVEWVQRGQQCQTAPVLVLLTRFRSDFVADGPAL